MTILFPESTSIPTQNRKSGTREGVYGGAMKGGPRGRILRLKDQVGLPTLGIGLYVSITIMDGVNECSRGPRSSFPFAHCLPP